MYYIYTLDPFLFANVITYIYKFNDEKYIDNIFMKWIKSKSELRQFMNETNQKYQSVKFGFKFSKESIEFLDILIYIKRFQTILYKKTTDCQNYFNVKSTHPFPREKVSLIVRHSELSTYAEPSRNGEKIPKT